jgi:mannose-6-phosphate isomerase-like protein (cupin superfamily)
VARFTFSRLSRLPTQEEGGGLRRYTVLNAAGMPAGEVGHAVLKPGADVAIAADAQRTLLFTIAGRGAVLLDDNRIEVAVDDLVYIEPGCSYALKTVGISNWVYVVVRGGGGEPADAD